MGEVYLAEDTTLKRPVALKRLARNLSADERFRERFMKEAERASSLSHPNIAGVYDVLEVGGEPFLVMEYVEGVTLRARMSEPLSLDAFLNVALQTLEALVAAHEKRIVHRDLKPENIMLAPDGRVKVLDFGVARRLPRYDQHIKTDSYEPGTEAGLSGTPAYMAPETLLNKPDDARADIFSLGVVFYEALTGRHPFQAATFVATTDRILHEDPPPPSEVRPQVHAVLGRIVMKMLAKEPAKRYATAPELLRDLREFERTRTASGVALPVDREGAIKRRRNVGLLIFALMAALVAVILWNTRRPPPPGARVRVALLPYANPTGNKQLEPFRWTLTQILVLDLTGSPSVQVLPYERLLEITRGFQAEGKDLYRPAVIQAIAGYSNSRFVVVPEMFAVGNTLRVSAEFRDAMSGETVGTTRVERTLAGSPEETIYRMQDGLAEKIETYFRRAGRLETQPARFENSAPKTVTAGLHFTEGKNAFARGDYAQALRSYGQVVEEDPAFAEAYARMGQIYGLLGYDARARDLSQKGAKLIRPQTPVLEAYFIQANLAERSYDYTAAEQRYLDLIRLYPDDPAAYADLAAVYEKMAQYPKAIARYREAIQHDSNFIVAYQQLGSVYANVGDFTSALSYAEKALELYRALANRDGEAGASLVLGEVYRSKGDYPRAREFGESALKLFHASEHDVGVLRSTKLLGDIRASEGKFEEARGYYLQILNSTGEIHDNRLLAKTLMNVGVTYSREGDFQKAVDYWERSLTQGKLYGEYRDQPMLQARAQAMTNLGGVLIEYGPDAGRGLKYAQEAALLFRAMGDKVWEAEDLMLEGLYSLDAGQYSQARDQLRAALNLDRGAGANQRVAQGTYMLGRCYFFENQYEQALEALGNSLEVSRRIHDSFREAMNQILLGWTYSRLGEGARALALLEEGMQAARKRGYGELLPDGLNAEGELYRDRGEKDRARTSFQRGADLARGPSVSESSVEARANLALLETEGGDLTRALSQGQAAAVQARKLQHLHTEARALINLARVHLARKEYAESLAALDELARLGEVRLGLELRAEALAARGRALAGLGKKEKAGASYRGAREVVRQLRDSVAPGHRESFRVRLGTLGLEP